MSNATALQVGACFPVLGKRHLGRTERYLGTWGIGRRRRSGSDMPNSGGATG